MDEQDRRKEETAEEFRKRIARHQELCREWAEYHTLLSRLLEEELTQGVRRHRAAAAEYRRELHRSIVRHGENGRG